MSTSGHHLSLAELRFAKLKLGVEAADIRTPPRAVLVGECPSEAGQGRGFVLGGSLALFPWPGQGAGARLMRMAALTPAQWLGGFWRRNLFEDFRKSWSVTRARERASVLMPWLKAKAEPIDEIDLVRELRVVLLGSRVADAFCVPMWQQCRDQETVDGLVVRVDFRAIPHPSGRNQAYNSASARASAGAVVRWAMRLEAECWTSTE